MTKTFIDGKRWPATQRTVILQFDTVQEAEAWDAAGRPLTVWLHASAEDEQDQRDDCQDDEDRPEHVATVPLRVTRKPTIHHPVEFANLGRPQSKRRRQ